MADWNHWIADLEATPAQAPVLADRVLDRLVDQGIVRAERTGCVLGDVEGGHAPGPAFAKAVTKAGIGLMDQWANGLEIDVGRTVFYGEVQAGDRVTCPRCGIRPPVDVLLPVVEEWADGGPYAPMCPGCRRPVGLNDWRWPVPWACAEFGLRFWNWPPLAPAFRARLAGLLGHRTVEGGGPA
jgi:hypothetical protein